MKNILNIFVFILLFGGLYLSIINRLQIVASLILIVMILSLVTKLMEITKDKDKKEKE